ncbi:SRPBCC domain-containing protein [Paenibacillus eucommiae]|uniref:Uncharacterized protein YndB with AHSA1/START domain n=1 Tax=Paenibacillus eucommiae TaxID=1355755 RepID=A0ABS4J4Z2_9BACL|nr:SRPBCC domain-containing protein [Paenibacillus eucommiae]MBP1994898.1 uncharacterized protein YndB with AHSA1/START domain [Paenibacillus eucommiae]
MDLKYQFYIAAKKEDVWQILISPEGTKKTVYGSTIRSTFEIGASIDYVGPGKDGDETVYLYGNVLEFEPNQVLSYSEHPGPSYYPDHAEHTTRVTFTLETVGNCTKLTVINDQWSANHPSRVHTENNWPVILSNIKTYAETGSTLDLGW